MCISISDPGPVLNGGFDCQGEASRAPSRVLKLQQILLTWKVSVNRKDHFPDELNNIDE